MAYENRFRYEGHDLIYDLSCRHGAELCVQESHFMTVIDQLREVRWRVRRNDRLEGFQDALPKKHTARSLLTWRCVRAPTVGHQSAGCTSWRSGFELFLVGVRPEAFSGYGCTLRLSGCALSASRSKRGVQVSRAMLY